MTGPATEPAEQQSRTTGLHPQWRSVVLRRSLQLYLLGLFVLIPAHEVWYHFLLSRTAGDRGRLLYPENFLIATLSIFYWREIAAAARAWRREMVLVGVYSIAYWASVAANPASVTEALNAFPVSWLLPVLFVLLVTVAVQRFDLNPSEDLLPWLFAGMALVSAVGIVAYLVSFGVPRSFYEFIYVFRTYQSLFGSKHGVWYGDLTMGNYNIFAGALLAGFLLWVGWCRTHRPTDVATWTASAIWTALVALNFYICYSRGAIVALNVCVGLLLLINLRAGGQWRNRAYTAAALILFDVLLLAPPGAIDHWRGLAASTETNSAAQRLRQWHEVLDPSAALTDANWVKREVEEQRLSQKGLRAAAEGARIPEARDRADAGWAGKVRYYLLGLGPGTYGLVVGFGTNANTHNLFVNQFVTSGALGLLAFAALYGSLLIAGRPRHSASPTSVAVAEEGWVTLIAIALLGILTQYEFGYLGVSTGAVLFWLSALLCRKSHSLLPEPQTTSNC